MFMPMLMGYMMGRTLGGGMSSVGQQPKQPPRPVYADRSGFLYSGDRAVSRLAPGQALNPNAATTVRTRMSPTGALAVTRTVARGGFGSTGRGMSAGS